MVYVTEPGVVARAEVTHLGLEKIIHGGTSNIASVAQGKIAHALWCFLAHYPVTVAVALITFQATYVMCIIVCVTEPGTVARMELPHLGLEHVIRGDDSSIISSGSFLAQLKISHPSHCLHMRYKIIQLCTSVVVSVFDIAWNLEMHCNYLKGLSIM